MPKYLLKKEHYKQKTKTSCVPASVKIVLNYLGIKIDSEAYLRKIFKTKVTGTNIFNVGYLKDEKEWNIDVVLELGTMSELENYLKIDKIPVIVLVDTSFIDYWAESAAHVLVVVGMDEEHVFVNDTFFEAKEFKIPKNEFLEAWSVFQNLLIVIKKK